VKTLPPLGLSLVASSMLLTLCCIGPSEKAQRPVEVLELLPGPSWPLAQDASPWALPLPGHVAVFALPGLKESDVIRVSRDPRMAQWIPEIAVSDDGRFLLAGLESRSLWDLRRGRFLGVLRVDGAYAWLPLGPDAERVAILRGSRGSTAEARAWLTAACESGLSEGCQQLFEAGEALALGEDERRLALERGCLAGGLVFRCEPGS
jgi:hypothetical protein